MRKLFLLFFFQAFIGLNAQEINVNFNDMPLNEAIVEIRDTYDLYFSFNVTELSKYKISVSGRFVNVEEFLDEALIGLPLTYKRSGQVILIIPVDEPEVIREYTLTGRIMDRLTNESLPFSHVIVNNVGMITDLDGYFTFKALNDSLFILKVSYLGYFVYDTVVSAGVNVSIGLMPSVLGLEEVVVEGREIDFSAHIGEKAGEMRLNHMISKFLPGYGDNSVFNLLRMQPGVMAAGDNTSNFTIWGSYNGQNQVIYDGFTLFGLKNFYSQISTVNPFMVKEIQVKKGGYGAEWGEKAGSIIDIYGIEGDQNKVNLNLLVNNVTVNAMVSVPVTKNTVFALAFRQTYYNLYKNEDFVPLFVKNRKNTDESQLSIVPDYDFRDFNTKYSGNLKNGDQFFLSSYIGGDQFNYILQKDLRINRLEIYNKENNEQYGVAGYYNHKWSKGNSTSLLAGTSALGKELRIQQEINRILTGRTIYNKDKYLKNTVNEYHLTLYNTFYTSNKNTFKTGIGIKNTRITLREDTMNINFNNVTRELNNYFVYLSDEYNLSKHISFNPGLRLNYPENVEQIYIQPRISLNLKYNEYWKSSLAWGIYNQFIDRSMVIDNNNNIYYVWTIVDNNRINAIESKHYVVNISREKNGNEFSVDGYYKTTEGIKRIEVTRLSKRVLQDIETESFGIDFYLKKDIKKHSFWVSYSLGKVMETVYERGIETVTQSAINDQRHEIKFAGLVNLNPFYFSANYVYGSGFKPYNIQDTDNSSSEIPYNRCDLSVIYRFKSLKFRLETGISVLNVFNTENVQYDNSFSIPDDNETIDVHLESVPFTPTLFLNLAF